MSDKVTWETPTTYNIREDKNVRPCPVCNQKNTLKLITEYWSKGYGMGESYGYDMTIKCTYCGMKVYKRYAEETHQDQYFSRTKDKIVKAWNEIAENRQSTVVVQNRTRLKWTKEKPTENGFYWWRNKEVDGNTLTVAIVRMSDRTARFIGCDPFCCLDGVGGEWSGPIPEPEE